MTNEELELEHTKVEHLIDTITKPLYKRINELENIIDEIVKELWKVRQTTFTKYKSNEWNNCLSFNDDIEPIIEKIKKLRGNDE